MFVTADVRYPRQSISDQRRTRRDHISPAEQAEILRTCRTVITDLLRRPDEPDTVARTLDRLRNAVETGAGQGLSTDLYSNGLQRAAGEIFEQISRTAPDDHDNDRLVAMTKRLIEIREMTTSVITEVAVTPPRPAATAPAVPFHIIASTLGDMAMGAHGPARRIDDTFALLAITFAPQADSTAAASERERAGQRAVWGIRTALANRCDMPALSTLGTRGGTVLIPARETTDADLEELICTLSAAAHVPVTATVTFAPRSKLVEYADHAHDMLDLVRRLEYPAGLYRFADVALEYQITRPGRARDRLATILDPLDDHPHLMQTLLTHLRTNLNRRDTARVMNLHRNTIDYRLRRIEEFTGYDPLTQPGLWYLQAALVVRTYCRTASPDPGITASAGA